MASPRPEEIELPPSPELDGEFLADPRHQTSSPSSLSSRPDSLRRVTSPDALPSPTSLSAQLTYRPRNRSPLAHGTHLRSHSSTPSLTAPPMMRAHSSPAPDTNGRFSVPLNTRRPASPLNNQGRRRSPLRSAVEESYPGTPTWSGLSIEPNIPEHAELDLSNTNRVFLSDLDFEKTSPIHHTFPRVRRRPSSPLYQPGNAQTVFSNPPTISPSPRSSQSSPILSAQKYTNEPYPNSMFSAASSMPSTPTSLRSRSPSMSSLETIPDTPDAEEAAQLEVEDLLKMRAATDSEDGDTKEGTGHELRRRGSLEMRGYGFGKEKRKRWSVCGAERRGDLDVIWED